MDSQLEGYMSELGGKNGSLDYLRDDVGDMRPHIVPSVCFGISEGLSERSRMLLDWVCDAFDTDDVIVRTSEKNDYKGLIDAMPTEEGKLVDVDSIVRDVQDKCRDSRIAAYSRKEGGDYDPERVTISVAPLVNGHRGLVTEHPNVPGVICVDVMKRFTEKSDSCFHESVDFLNGRAISIHGYDCDSSSEMYATHGLMLRDIVRESGAFPDEQALQYEFVLGRAGAFLTQVKWFADTNLTNCSSAEIEKVLNAPVHRGYRNFGITPPDGLVLPCVRGDLRQDFLDFEAKYPGIPYAFHLSYGGLSKKLRIDDLPMNMRAYLPPPKPPLTHQNARFVQSCLRRDGVAFLNTPHTLLCTISDNVKVTADGLNVDVKRV